MKRFIPAIFIIGVVLATTTTDTARAQQNPTPDEILACQKSLPAQGEILSHKIHGYLNECLQGIISRAFSGAKKTCEDNATRYHAAKSDAFLAIRSKCDNVHPELLGYPCDRDAFDIEDTAFCVVNNTSTLTQKQISFEFTDACSLLESVGLDQTFSDVCGTP